MRCAGCANRSAARHETPTGGTAMIPARDQWGPFNPEVGPEERDARRRELKALALAYCGPDHPLTRALTARTPEALEQALAEINAMAPLSRRRLLATYALLKDALLKEPAPPY